MNKKKIINDPVYGFIQVPTDLIFDVFSHAYFQRLRNIKQLGMTHLVYPGALHTRFHHALGAMHLMGLAIEVLRSKGVEISAEEEEAAQLAILLHDIGHGPFSHALESTLVKGLRHELLSLKLMESLNDCFQGRLSMAIEIFTNQYPKRFLHQLISGQLDLDRMDYLNRDSFFTGVSEGVISFDRIIKMLNIHNGDLVVEEKGIYSIENFLIARRLMYWQVYLHKTVCSAELLLVKILERAKDLSLKGQKLFASPALSHFLQNEINGNQLFEDPIHLQHFTKLDDHDIFTAIKVWCEDPDFILSKLCKMLCSRKLYKVEISQKEASATYISKIKARLGEHYQLSETEAEYFVFTQKLENRAYHAGQGKIQILMKNNTLLDIAKASDLSNLSSLQKTVEKYVLCFPKELVE